MSEIAIDRPLPEFSAPATGGQTVGPDTLRGHRAVLYFYPKDNTPGCTTEGQDFRDLHAEFEALDTLVYGISRDGLKSHENFRAKHGFPFHLIADPDETLCRLFGAIRPKKLYGREVMGIERSTFLVDRAGVLRREWRKVRVPGHVQDVLAAVRALED
ncbi:MAG: peroxiredoxin [Candidatus Competibacterales bacterium]|nr:peroxiredoxin [Candidatus Competibacterales bacterium]